MAAGSRSNGCSGGPAPPENRPSERRRTSGLPLIGCFWPANACGKPITFQRGLNRDVAFVDAAYSCKGTPCRQKDRFVNEQKGVVAAPSQLRTIGAPALPRSNQIEATLFDEGHTDNNGEPLMKRLLLGSAAIIAFAAPAFAADMPARTYTNAPAYTAPEVFYNWTVFYIGFQLRGAFACTNTLHGTGRP